MDGRDADSLEADLAQELENDRLFRLAVKLGWVNERPEYDMDPSWSETGDRYLLKLFRDYVFHQVDVNGGPHLDVGHVIQSLNKLDISDTERLLLTSRDERTSLIVSYYDLRRCLEAAVYELQQRADRLSSAEGQQPGPY